MRGRIDRTPADKRKMERRRAADIAPTGARIGAEAPAQPHWRSPPTLHGTVTVVAMLVTTVFLLFALYPLLRERQAEPCLALERLALRRGVSVTALLPTIGEAGPRGWPRCTVAYWLHA